MLIITIPDNFIPERKYVLKILFCDFLGLDININSDQGVNNTIVSLPNNNRIIIEDHFFNQFKNPIDYLKPEHIPRNVLIRRMSFTSEADIIILFGNEKLVIEETSSEKTIICGNDILAAIFFMLSRWEEHVSEIKDKHSRFPDEESLLFKNHLNHRPIVNEYVEFMWNVLKHSGYGSDRKKLEYEPYITHDVDNIARYDSLTKFMKAMAGDLILRKNPRLLPVTVRDFIGSNLKMKNDNYDTFDFLMDCSERRNLLSNFYFIPLKKHESTATYDIEDKKVARIIEKISLRGHRIGIHGSYNSYDNEIQFNIELERLKKFNEKISEGRQHYFRFKVPDTWQIWENSSLKFDSSFGFNKDIGFRCGVCYEFNTFNILTRKELKLKERPLIFMEVALVATDHALDQYYYSVSECIETVKKYNGKFVLLWHNNSFNFPDFSNFNDLYVKIFNTI